MPFRRVLRAGRFVAVVTGLMGLVAVPSGGCMTVRFLATDYDDRDEDQWLTALGVDLAVGAALVATSFLVGDDGPEPYTLSAGAIWGGMALIMLPLASYPTEPVEPSRPLVPPP